MAKLFDLAELNKEPAVVAGSGILKDNFLDTHLAKVENIKHLLGRLPLPGEIFFIWTLNSFNAFTFIPYMIKSQGVITELTISTYSMSSRILNALTHYMEKGKIERVNLLISDSIKFRIPKVNDQLISVANARKGQFTVSYAWNHSKVCMMHTGEGHYLVEGSGNFSENAQYEQYVFMNSQSVYTFRKEMIDGFH